MTQLSKTKTIVTLAEAAAEEFCTGNVTSLKSIAKSEGVRFYFDNYEDAFDGMLVYDDLDFHIHINVDLGNTEESKRGRFTFAHELGHFFLDDHRLGLKYGLLEPHASFHEMGEKPLIEVEADYFAGCLLMPTDKFRKLSGGKKFSVDTIVQLSQAFNCSFPATIIRFAGIGTHEICAVCSKDNTVLWSVRSDDFPKWRGRFSKGSVLPRNTVAGDYFTGLEDKLTGIEKVDAFDWFIIPREDNRGHRTLYEQCYYSGFDNHVMSLLWFD